MSTQKKKSTTTDKSIWVWVGIVVAAFVIVGIMVVSKNQPQLSSVPIDTRPIPTSTNIEAIYTCDDGKAITANYLNNVDKVNLQLSSGKMMTLPHAMSANGARYANKDESIVFWNVGNTAFLEENGVQTYSNCVTKS